MCICQLLASQHIHITSQLASQCSHIAGQLASVDMQQTSQLAQTLSRLASQCRHRAGQLASVDTQQASQHSYSMGFSYQHLFFLNTQSPQKHCSLTLCTLAHSSTHGRRFSKKIIYVKTKNVIRFPLAMASPCEVISCLKVLPLPVAKLAIAVQEATPTDDVTTTSSMARGMSWGGGVSWGGRVSGLGAESQQASEGAIERVQPAVIGHTLLHHLLLPRVVCCLLHTATLSPTQQEGVVLVVVQ